MRKFCFHALLVIFVFGDLSSCSNKPNPQGSDSSNPVVDFYGKLEANAASIVSGNIYEISSALNPNFAIADANNVISNGLKIIGWVYGGGNDQKWTVSANGDGYYRIINVNSGLALDDTGGSKTNGNPLQLWAWAASPYNPNQEWAISNLGNGYYSVINRTSSLAMDDKGGSTVNGNPIQQWSFSSGNPNQEWQFTLLSGNSSSSSSNPLTNAFTIVVIPDSQMYSDNYNGGISNYFTCQTKWIVSNQSSLNVVLVTHVGDLIDNGTSINQYAYTNAVVSMNILRNSSIPYDFIPGNHEGYDTTYNYNYTNLAYYNQYFPVSTLSGKAFFGGSYPQGTLNNDYVLFSVDGMDFINVCVGCLGFNGTSIDNGAVAWANNILRQYPGRRAIVTTHDYMNSDGIDATGTTLWNSLITSNTNVFMVICGHNCYEDYVVSTNIAGNPVFGLLTDWQSDPDGGDGWLRYYTFYPSQNKITAFTYSPVLNESQSDGNSQFSMTYQMN